jgi:NADH-quinone oxidoreductase subunit M
MIFSNLYFLLAVPVLSIIYIVFTRPTDLPSSSQGEHQNSIEFFIINAKKSTSNNNKLIIPFILSTFTSFIHCLYLYIFFNSQTNNYQFLSTLPTLELHDLFNSAEYFSSEVSLLAIDGISIAFIVLTPFIIFLCAGLTHQLPISFEERKFYYLCLLFIEFFLFLAFTTTNIIVFYFAFEAVLLPIFLMIGRWGSNVSKKQAANYMFVYTVLGSVLMLFAILTMINYYGVSSFTALKTFITTETSSQINFWWWCFFIGFAVKVPVCPFHLWLPEAHVEAPAAGSVILAALLLKLGGYGFIRVLLDIMNYQTKLNQIFATTFGVMSVLWGCGVILTLTDIKRVIAFSSIIHMNLVVIGLFAFNYQAIQGAITVMISHALCSAGLFMCIGMLYSRYHTRDLPTLTGLAKTMPVFSFVFGFYSLANMALPGTFNFVGELILLQGIFLNDPVNLIICGYAVVFSALYSLALFSRISFGTLTNYFREFFDISDKPYTPSWTSEFIWQLPLIVPTLLLGIAAFPILELINAAVVNLEVIPS